EGRLAALAECAAGIGDLQVRNRGTVGGGLAHADPAGDAPAVALALDVAIDAHGPQGARSIPAAEFVLGPYETALAAGELAVGIRVPVPPAGSGSAYVKVEHPASGFALAGAAALVLPDGSSRIALTGIGGAPVLLADESGIDELEVAGDRFAGADYRRHLARVVVRRALERARARTEGGAP
ncbi:MAG: FAD binding domain-containing protein, partial [Thermoleophilia bacterium]|nr:FAD binding domain-containing protein [Thermoleophilia bacterium]